MYLEKYRLQESFKRVLKNNSEIEVPRIFAPIGEAPELSFDLSRSYKPKPNIPSENFLRDMLNIPEKHTLDDDLFPNDNFCTESEFIEMAFVPERIEDPIIPLKFDVDLLPNYHEPLNELILQPFTIENDFGSVDDEFIADVFNKKTLVCKPLENVEEEVNLPLCGEEMMDFPNLLSQGIQKGYEYAKMFTEYNFEYFLDEIDLSELEIPKPFEFQNNPLDAISCDDLINVEKPSDAKRKRDIDFEFMIMGLDSPIKKNVSREEIKPSFIEPEKKFIDYGEIDFASMGVYCLRNCSSFFENSKFKYSTIYDSNKFQGLTWISLSTFQDLIIVESFTQEFVDEIQIQLLDKVFDQLGSYKYDFILLLRDQPYKILNTSNSLSSAHDFILNVLNGSPPNDFFSFHVCLKPEEVVDLILSRVSNANEFLGNVENNLMMHFLNSFGIWNTSALHDIDFMKSDLDKLRYILTFPFP
ncbi:hypothetical protein O9G_004492 [Rozella allomycis CSF55]|uniref:Uncharacterized protein n=1 Tax=Rozella allomycis (strain CSF55) TaxID=988480 RepID=A0A075AWR7_ROZAC|nr:hypothetical protein O9G_004492 [Rozella allomycis CSF55]|eukprot:EPZ34780.1 hypothetical protein O9G_004492 [Rozella allomycis CSF55]